MTDQTPTHTLTDAERTDLREAILRAGYGGDGYVFAAVERILAARGGNTDSTLPRQVERGAECFHGVERGCESYRCGSNCSQRFDRMHPCPACLVAEIHDLRAALDAAPAPTNEPTEDQPLHFGYLRECPDGMDCQRHGCLQAHVAAPTDNQHNNDLADRIRAEIPPLCWVLRSTSNTGPVCTDMIGGRSPGGYEWTPDMCCLPCRLRAVVDGPTTPTHTPAASEGETNP